MRTKLLAALFVLSACSGTSSKDAEPLPPLNLPAGCQPVLGGADCFLPYPSDFFLADDARQPSGSRVTVTGAARLKSADNHPADVNEFRPVDGFSRLPTLVTFFPEDISPEGFTALADPAEKSLGDASNVILIEAATGERIPHYVDLDPRAQKPEKRAIVIQPIVPLKEKSRYVVALRNVKTTAGALAATPEGFRRLREGLLYRSDDPQLAPLRARYERLFGELAKAGIGRNDLQQAWDFTTGSDSSVERDMLKVRALTLEWLKTNTPKVTVTKVDESPTSKDAWRIVKGTFTAPLFMEKDEAGAKLHRDAFGDVAQNGTLDVPFWVQIPVAVRDQFGPGMPIAYGHGFFGSGEEVTYGAPRQIAMRLKAVLFGIDWQGMALADSFIVAGALTGTMADTMIFTERVDQAMANWIAFTNAIPKSFRDAPELRRPTMAGAPGVSTDASGKSNAGEPLYEATLDKFLGISQGHILGSTMCALNPDMKRVVLNVGGGGFSHMLFRSRNFDAFLNVLELGQPDHFEQRKFMATMQRQFDYIDPAFWAPRLVTHMLDGSPTDRRVLQQFGLGDVQVPNLGSLLYARAAGFPLLTPAPITPYGIQTVTGPVEGSAAEAYDFKLDTTAIYLEDKPNLMENEVHEGVRLLPTALNQMETFYKEGRIQHFCDGVCDPN